MAHGSRKRKLMGDINVVPYIDVMLVLLIIFMVTAPLLMQGVKVDLPKAAAEPLDPALLKNANPLVLSIDKAGKLYLNVGSHPENPLDDDTVGARTAAALRRKRRRMLTISGGLFVACVGALALAHRKKRWAMAAAAALFGIAYVAHALPVAWALSVFVYGRVAQALAPRRRVPLAIGALAALALVGFLLGAFFPTRRGPDQFMAMTGADQFWIYGRYYIGVAVAVLAAWALGIQHVLNPRGAARTVLDVRFQLCALSAAALVLLPGGVPLPGFRSGLDFVAERMSLAGA